MNKKADEKFLARALSQNVKFTTEKLLEPALDEYPPPFWTSEEMPKRSVRGHSDSHQSKKIRISHQAATRTPNTEITL